MLASPKAHLNGPVWDVGNYLRSEVPGAQVQVACWKVTIPARSVSRFLVRLTIAIAIYAILTQTRYKPNEQQTTLARWQPGYPATTAE